MYGMRPVGFVRTPFAETSEIPKGRGAKHEAEGLIEIEPELAPGLADTEGFSHLYVIWAFHKSEVDIKPYLSNVPDEELRRGWMDDAGKAR